MPSKPQIGFDSKARRFTCNNLPITDTEARQHWEDRSADWSQGAYAEMARVVMGIIQNISHEAEPTMSDTITQKTSAQRDASFVGSDTLVRRLRSLLSLLSMVESGDALVGATDASLAMRQQLRADVAMVSAEIAALSDGPRILRRATESCPACDGRGHAQSYELEPPQCMRCAGTGYRFPLPNKKPGKRQITD